MELPRISVFQRTWLDIDLEYREKQKQRHTLEFVVL